MCSEIIISSAIGILSLLVTVLIGWQIFTAIGIEKRLGKLKKKLTKEIRCDIQKAKFDAAGVALAQIGLAMFNQTDYSNAFLLLMNAGFNLKEGSGDAYNAAAKQNAARMLCEIVDTGLQLTLESQEAKDDYLKRVDWVENMEQRQKVLLFILAAKTRIADA